MNRKTRRALRLTQFEDQTGAQAAPPVAEETATELPQYWTGVIGVENQLTGDGRLIETEALSWETPIPLRFAREDNGGHDGAVVVGRILHLARGEDGMIEAAGDFDLGHEDGREAARQVGAKFTNGVSMDLDSVAFEVRVDGEVLREAEEAEAAFWEAIDNGEDPEMPERETDSEGRVIVARIGNADEVMAMTSARMRGATIVSIPAFADALIYGSHEVPEVIATALVASGAPVDPPAAWFAVPEPDGPRPLTITDDGQVFGHLATWDQCHIADPNGAGVCVMAPKSPSAYAYFHTGLVKAQEGDLIPTGVIRFNTGHASMKLNAAQATAHYDNTGLAAADVHAVDGKYGIWLSGAARPGTTPEDFRTLRASPLSGDWRYIGGKLDLVGALAVNLPGFPVPRPSGLVASGALQGLVAAGVLTPRRPSRNITTGLTPEDSAWFAHMIRRDREASRLAVKARVDEAKNRDKLSAFLAKRGR